MEKQNKFLKFVNTADNSTTFFNEEYNETYHSTSGALEESFKKFIEPSNLKENTKILDICFGIGYNSYAAIKTCKKISITALENDKDIINKIQTINIDQEYEIIKQLAKNLEYKDKNYNLKLILGDAKVTIKQLKDKFDYIFLDPFSPKKCPELWTESFFKDIYKLCNSGAILTTYSCARVVRDNLKKAGFQVKDGPCVGRRAPSTIAIKQLF
jgi:tRNA U34 5-methylaminomethyl-2-thiouridine-forming methyltransferase MnmC